MAELGLTGTEQVPYTVVSEIRDTAGRRNGHHTEAERGP